MIHGLEWRAFLKLNQILMRGSDLLSSLLIMCSFFPSPPVTLFSQGSILVETVPGGMISSVILEDERFYQM